MRAPFFLTTTLPPSAPIQCHVRTVVEAILQFQLRCQCSGKVAAVPDVAGMVDRPLLARQVAAGVAGALDFQMQVGGKVGWSRALPPSCCPSLPRPPAQVDACDAAVAVGEPRGGRPPPQLLLLPSQTCWRRPPLPPRHLHNSMRGGKAQHQGGGGGGRARVGSGGGATGQGFGVASGERPRGPQGRGREHMTTHPTPPLTSELRAQAATAGLQLGGCVHQAPIHRARAPQM